MKLKSIEAEAADCRAAWAKKPEAKYGVHIHHATAAEPLSEPIENRIAYILAHKPKEEQALRLRLMRPVRAAAFAEYDKVRAAALAEYAKPTDAAWAEYDKVTDATWAEYQKATAAAWAEYDKAKAPGWAEYAKVTDAAWAEYQKATAPAWAEYDKVRAALHKAICPTQDCPFDGQTIFPKKENAA